MTVKVAIKNFQNSYKNQITWQLLTILYALNIDYSYGLSCWSRSPPKTHHISHLSSNENLLLSHQK